MSYLNIARPRLLGILSLALACLGLTACGGSSGGSTQATVTATPTVAGAPATSGASTTSPSVSTSTPRPTAPAQGAPGATASASRQAQVFKRALGAYDMCLRQSGVALPKASGKTPFSLKGVDTKSVQFRAAAKKCRAVLIGALRSARPASK